MTHHLVRIEDSSAFRTGERVRDVHETILCIDGNVWSGSRTTGGIAFAGTRIDRTLVDGVDGNGTLPWTQSIHRRIAPRGKQRDTPAIAT